MPGSKNSVTVYVIAILTIIAAILLATLLLFDQTAEERRRSAELRSTLDINADQLAASLALPAWNFDRPQLDKIADAAMQERDVYAVIVQLRDASASNGTSIIGRVRDPKWQSVPAAKVTSPPGMLSASRDIIASGQKVGSLQLFSTPVFMERELTSHLIYTAATYLPIGIVLIAFLYLLLWQNVLKPLQQLEQYAFAISTGRQPPVPALEENFRGELANLQSAMKKMLDLLNARYASLQQNQAMLSSVLDSVPQSIFWKDRNSVYLGANGAFAKNAGLPDAASIIGKTDFDFPWADIALEYQEDDRRIISTGVARNHFIARLTVSSGQSIWVEATKSPLCDRDGVIYGVLGIYEDISARKSAEEANHRQTAFNEIANEVLAGLVGTTGPELDAKLRKTLKSMAEFLEMHHAFIAQMSEDNTWSYTHEWCDQYFPSSIETNQHVPLGTRPWCEGKLFEGELIVVTDVESLPPEAVASQKYWKAHNVESVLYAPLRGAGGRTHGCIGLLSRTRHASFTDEDLQRLRLLSDAVANAIERRQTEIALKESEARFRILIEQAPIAISISRNGKWLYFNSAYAKMFEIGPREEAMANKSMIDHVAPECRPQILDRISRRQENNSVSDGYECVAVLPDGTRFPYYIEVATVEFSDGPANVAFLTDLTERTRSQALLMESEKLRTVAGLASGVAHEINNPLAGMVQNAQVVLNRLTQDTPANREAAERHGVTFQAIRAYIADRDIPEMIETIRASGRQASRIVQNLLAYSRRDAPKSVVSLSDLVERTLELAATDFELRKSDIWASVAIVRNFASPAPWVPCYAAQIQQVLLNLIRNAVHAMKTNPPERPRKITFHTYSDQNFGCVSVEDTGSGIPPEIQSKIFEPFFTTKAEGEGTGLGLFVSYHILRENHGGYLTVESSPEKGSQFLLRLPRDSDRPALPEQLRSRIDQGTKAV